MFPSWDTIKQNVLQEEEEQAFIRTANLTILKIDLSVDLWKQSNPWPLSQKH